MRKALCLSAVLFIIAQVAMALPRTQSQMKSAAMKALNSHRSTRNMAPSATELEVLRATAELQVIGSTDGGFAVVAVDDALPAVLGVSLSHYSGGHNPNFEWWLTATAQAAAHIASSKMPMHVTTPDPIKYPEEVAPMLTTKWDQDTPYNNLCPVFNGSVRCLTGCVATAMAQVLNYHKTPQHGQGARTIYYPKNRPSGEAVTANFEEDYYDWDNMLDIYTPGNYMDEQADAVALLMRDCGVAANMEYGGPIDGSGAYSDEAAEGLRLYFGFEKAECLDRSRFNEPAWMDIIYRELSENGPLYYGGASYSSGGHAFVFDGYNAEGMVSVNWGWSGDDDGFFHVSQLNPSYYNFNMQQDMIIGIQSSNHSKVLEKSVVTTAGGQLRELVESSIDDEDATIGSLTVEGPLNGSDLLYLRLLAGKDTEEVSHDGKLRILDLTKAVLEQNTLPEATFKGCTSLRRVRLPEKLATIGDEAFYGCDKLTEMRVTCKSVPELQGENVFYGMPFGMAKLFVLSGMKAKYTQAAQWKQFGEANIFQVGTTVKARNAARVYGQPNPELKYTVTGDAIEGEPSMICEAKTDSPVGRYAIYISAGSVVNSEAVNFADGYLIVQKADAKATVADAERFVGEPNPKFKLRYDGLVAGDSEPAWTVEPTFVTMASEYSPAGEYLIMVQGGEAQNYNITFTYGKLTVKPALPSAITDIEKERSTDTYYNLNGQRTEANRKGIYIRSGKKVLK